MVEQWNRSTVCYDHESWIQHNTLINEIDCHSQEFNIQMPFRIDTAHSFDEWNHKFQLNEEKKNVDLDAENGFAPFICVANDGFFMLRWRMKIIPPKKWTVLCVDDFSWQRTLTVQLPNRCSLFTFYGFRTVLNSSNWACSTNFAHKRSVRYEFCFIRTRTKCS